MANLGYPAIKGWLVNILIHNNPKIKDYISTHAIGGHRLQLSGHWVYLDWFNQIAC